MNYKNDEMMGKIAPTDSRCRKDVDYYERGLDDDAEREKNNIETEQRRKRKLREDGVSPQWKPMFFKSEKHPYVTTEMLDGRLGPGEEHPIQWKLIENEGDNKGYWERRKNKDWDDLPKLFGPFEE